MKFSTVVIALAGLMATACSTGSDYSENLQLLGGSLPGDSAIIFSKGFISETGNYEFASTFNPDLTEFYYTRRTGDANQIYVSRFSDGIWSGPEKAAFSTSPSEYEPHISPDGKYIYWGSYRTLPGENEAPSYARIWRAPRIGDDWGEPSLVDLDCMMYVSADNNGRLFYTHVGFMLGNPDGLPYDKPLIVYSQESNGTFSPPVIDMKTDSALYPGAHPCISPDGSFIIFDSNQRIDTYGNTDLYISFRGPDVAWSEAANMGPKVNTPGEDMCPSLTPGGKYIMFARFDSNESDIFWIDASIIENLEKSIN